MVSNLQLASWGTFFNYVSPLLHYKLNLPELPIVSPVRFALYGFVVLHSNHEQLDAVLWGQLLGVVGFFFSKGVCLQVCSALQAEHVACIVSLFAGIYVRGF